MNQLILLSGPSCVGKSPLFKSFRKMFPDLAKNYEKLVLYNDRQPRPGEEDGKDYHFRSRRVIEELREREDYRVVEVRDDLQAVCLDDIHKIIQSGKNAFYEGAVYVVAALREEPRLAEVQKTAIFLSPLAREEIRAFKEMGMNFDLEQAIVTLQRRKLLIRKKKQRDILSLPDLEEIETRCHTAYREMQEAWKYDFIIPNHNGEDSENWTILHEPIGDARKSVQAFVSILQSAPVDFIEHWDENLLSPTQSASGARPQESP